MVFKVVSVAPSTFQLLLVAWILILVSWSYSEKYDFKKQDIYSGAILPHSTFTSVKRTYNRRLSDALQSLKKGRDQPLNINKYFNIKLPKVVQMSLNPSPTEILNKLCDDLLSNDVIAVLYLTNSDFFGSNAASVQYFLQLSGYLGLPVIAWNADNFGVEQQVSGSLILQLAPSVKHQSAAMLSIMKRYFWHHFSILTTIIGGHDDFIRAVRNQVLDSTDFTYNIMDVFVIKTKTRKKIAEEIEFLKYSEVRVILLYSTKEEGAEIMGAANDLGITGKNYVWIVTQSVFGTAENNAPTEFPIGMLGVHFNTTKARLQDEIERAFNVFGYGLELFVNDPRNENKSLSPGLKCNGISTDHWSKGDMFFRYLRNVSIPSSNGGPNLEFNPDGTLKYVELEVMNLKSQGYWEKIGAWTAGSLEIKDIVWPGDSPVPPKGVPEKFNLKITFMEEPPYVNLVTPDNETGECKTDRAVPCRVAPESELAGVNLTLAMRNPKYYMCCSGFCVDLLHKFAVDLGFTYDLYRVEDGIWGVLNNGTWNGLVAEILEGRADVVVTSFKINSERQTVLDFTVPFLETGITIIVAKHTGIISPKAFLEPFDTLSWLLILLVSIQVAAFAIFLFEWLSPFGYDMKMSPPRDHKFSLFRTYWLVWAILFGASVNLDCPRGYTARFMSNIWAMFAVVFLAIYTANLAAFMITREEFYDLSGIEDKRLHYPFQLDPPFRFGTVPLANTWTVMKDRKPGIFNYMKRYNRSSPIEGIKAVKTGELDAFIYDATVLEYLAGQDNECRLLTVGAWCSMTGYGFAFPKKSKYLNMFNKYMIQYRENGDLDRLQRFWLQGICKPTKNKRNASNPLDTNQFMSAFLLLGCGVILTLVLLGLEHVYFKYIRQHLAKKDTGSCFALVSLSMGKSLSFRGAVYEAQDMLKRHRCTDPICDTQLWKARHELDMARLKLKQLQKELFLRTSSVDPLEPRDFTRNHSSTNESQTPPSRLYYRPMRKEIAEYETVI
ncbi:glutamate receptor ionotropic, NMDA 2B-like isoform X1 [Limulus polyphemus]|uniref:Glutamate receptor ionotropic, NMDA 2B-like isoform X1 n=2 Tax=Limulus polyphemus TaxID=6850 RepID=A0ABM1BGQ1_LIMPO|nr:glutamate receptor ionotropic, NMDA 2B-like isoform X1 [Limulus polyphemus]XP_022250183.1 glutamate receptor ionotropic, NMDA 2B-like isoform X1 [Limulus polyphemus]